MLQNIWYCQLQGTESSISCAFCPCQEGYLNVSFLASSCESHVFYIWDEDMTAAANEAEASTSSARRLWRFNFTLFYLPITLKRHLWRIRFFVLAILRCSVLFCFHKISVIALRTNQLLLVFVGFSVLCLGILCHFCLPRCLWSVFILSCSAC